MFNSVWNSVIYFFFQVKYSHIPRLRVTLAKHTQYLDLLIIIIIIEY